MGSPTSRTLQLLKKEGWTCQVVEKWVPQAFKRIDLFGCIDLLAVKGKVTLGIQATSSGNVSSRVSKSLDEPRLQIWLGAGNKFEVWGWSKKGAKGKRKLWSVRRKEITLTPTGMMAVSDKEGMEANE